MIAVAPIICAGKRAWMLSLQGSFRPECIPYFFIAWPPFRTFNLSNALANKFLGSVDLVELARVATEKLHLIAIQKLALAHCLDGPPNVIAVVMIDVGRPGQNIFVKVGQARRRRLIPLEPGNAVLEESLAGQALERLQPPVVAVKLVCLIAFVQQETEPRRGRFEHGCSNLRVVLEET